MCDSTSQRCLQFSFITPILPIDIVPMFTSNTSSEGDFYIIKMKKPIFLKYWSFIENTSNNLITT